MELPEARPLPRSGMYTRRAGAGRQLRLRALQGLRPMELTVYCECKCRVFVFMLSSLVNQQVNRSISMACTKESDDKQTFLQQAFKRSKIYCKCGCPIHREKCPLVPRYAGERRWPGCDGCISAEDCTFLNQLQPQPEWWRKAKHKF